jgi:hypothetical protein
MMVLRKCGKKLPNLNQDQAMEPPSLSCNFHLDLGHHPIILGFLSALFRAAAPRSFHHYGATIIFSRLLKPFRQALWLAMSCRDSLLGLNDANRQIAGILREQYIDALLKSPKYAEPGSLNRFEFGVFSRHGQDGIIAEIFRRIGSGSKTFVEIAAGNGVENNTCYLLRQGWKGGWVECGKKELATISNQFTKELCCGDIVLEEAAVTAENIDEVIGRMNVPTDFDLFSLDIDRNTYWVWKAMEHFRPHVVVVEYNATVPPPVEWVVDYDATKFWNGSSYLGASLQSLQLLGEAKGYHLVGCELVGADAFFVRHDLCGDLFSMPFTAEHHYEPPRHFLWPARRWLHSPAFRD